MLEAIQRERHLNEDKYSFCKKDFVLNTKSEFSHGMGLKGHDRVELFSKSCKIETLKKKSFNSISWWFETESITLKSDVNGALIDLQGVPYMVANLQIWSTWKCNLTMPLSSNSELTAEVHRLFVSDRPYSILMIIFWKIKPTSRNISLLASFSCQSSL